MKKVILVNIKPLYICNETLQPVEITEKEQEVKYLYKNIIKTTYQTTTFYQTKTRYETEKKVRNVSVERSGISFGNIIWIVIASMVGGALLWTWLKSYLPKWRLNIFSKK